MAHLFVYQSQWNWLVEGKNETGTPHDLHGKIDVRLRFSLSLKPIHWQRVTSHPAWHCPFPATACEAWLRGTRELVMPQREYQWNSYTIKCMVNGLLMEYHWNSLCVYIYIWLHIDGILMEYVNRIFMEYESNTGFIIVNYSCELLGLTGDHHCDHPLFHPQAIVLNTTKNCAATNRTKNKKWN